MEREDFIMRQIMMITMFLRKLIGRLLGLEENGQTDLALETVRGSFQNELQINFDDLMLLDEASFFAILKEKQFSEANLSELAQLLVILGRNEDIEISLRKNNILKKALSIYLKLEKESHNYSLDRNEQIILIRQLLDN